MQEVARLQQAVRDIGDDDPSIFADDYAVCDSYSAERTPPRYRQKIRTASGGSDSLKSGIYSGRKIATNVGNMSPYKNVGAMARGEFDSSLRDKRAKKRDAHGADDENASETEVTTRPAPQPIFSGRDDRRTIFQMESKAAIEARKKDATRELVYAEDRGNAQSIYAYDIQDPANQPRILTKPKWFRDMSPDELNEMDDQAFKEWVEYLEQEGMDREDGAQLNLYERNVEVWRQLWRVIERSSVLVHLADARCPLLHISDQLMTHIRTQFPWKRVVLVLTKTDLVEKDRVQKWSSYLQTRYGHDIPVLAYSRDEVDESNTTLMRTIGQVSTGMDHHNLDDDSMTETKHKDTLTIGFVGEPNVGKSSLLNSLFDRKLRALRAPQQMRSLAVAVEKVDDDIPEASCRPEAKGPDCWKCHHATDCCSFFCKSCNAIQPIDKGCHCDYFEMFKVPKNFNLEQRSIEKTYWNLQKRLHPDLYGSKSELALHGIDALGETASTAVDPELLMQTMEIRERIAEAPDVNALHEIRKEISEHIDSIINKLGEVYDKDQDLESTKQYAVELQYMVKCAEEIDLREEKLDEY
ncbi:OTU domain-containing protein 1 [Phytophthora nicotianae]|uniref:Guanine nucleotide-binding protein-like 1 n=1 Tax=Phytophthora nicotianae TaxID=4792 RepID=A0A0W8DTK6_PHYNI|nr:OTU domain-containing protein 1 [Phytophthora nicotianae]